MNNYKVIKKNGVRSGAGELLKEGEIFTGSPRSATIQLQLRCREIVKVESKSEDQGDSEPKTIPQLREALEKLGVEIPEDITKSADLKALYEKAKSEDQGKD
jgi:hypothetical protein